jgi:hypothetical protein
LFVAGINKAENAHNDLSCALYNAAEMLCACGQALNWKEAVRKLAAEGSDGLEAFKGLLAASGGGATAALDILFEAPGLGDLLLGYADSQVRAQTGYSSSMIDAKGVRQSAINVAQLPGTWVLEATVKAILPMPVQCTGEGTHLDEAGRTERHPIINSSHSCARTVFAKVTSATDSS